MNEFLKCLLCIVVLPSYILAYMGFGLHHCSSCNSNDLVLLFGDVSCEAIHAHSHFHIHAEGKECHCHDHGSEACNSDEHQMHSTGCCTTEVFVLTEAQDSADGVSAEPAFLTAVSLRGNSVSAYFPSADSRSAFSLYDPPEVSAPLSTISVLRV